MEPLRLITQEGDVDAAIAEGKKYPETMVVGPAGSGKSLGCLQYLDMCAELFPGIRILVVRQTLTSLRESVQVTLEEKVWWASHPCLTESDAKRESKTGYTYPKSTNVVGGVTYTGRSHIMLGGLDKPERLFSVEHDLIFVEEAVEITLDAWEKLLRVVRNWRMPWQQIIAATNPGAENHWLNLRANKIDDKTGRTVLRRLRSVHKDNPRLWSMEKDDWTEEGREYLETKLGHMSGTTRERLLLGKWVNQTGAVFGVFNPDEHVIDATVGRRKDGELVVREKGKDDRVINQVIGSIDFGYRAPGSMDFWGCATDGQWFHLIEIYRSQRVEAWWADVFAKYYKLLRPSAVVADAADPGMIKALNIRIGRTDTNPIVRRCEKGWEVGRDCLDTLLQKDKNGRVGLQFLRSSLREGRDELMSFAGKPTCVLEELPGYIWGNTLPGKQDQERPVKQDDHGIDSAIMAARHILRHDYASKPKPHKFDADSYGAVLKGHQKRLRQARRAAH